MGCVWLVCPKCSLERWFLHFLSCLSFSRLPQSTRPPKSSSLFHSFPRPHSPWGGGANLTFILSIQWKDMTDVQNFWPLYRGCYGARNTLERGQQEIKTQETNARCWNYGRQSNNQQSLFSGHTLIGHLPSTVGVGGPLNELSTRLNRKDSRAKNDGYALQWSCFQAIQFNSFCLEENS